MKQGVFTNQGTISVTAGSLVDDATLQLAAGSKVTGTAPLQVGDNSVSGTLTAISGTPTIANLILTTSGTINLDTHRIQVGTISVQGGTLNTTIAGRNTYGSIGTSSPANITQARINLTTSYTPVFGDTPTLFSATNLVGPVAGLSGLGLPNGWSWMPS